MIIENKELMYMIKANLLDSLVEKLETKDILPGIQKVTEEIVMDEYNKWKHVIDEITPSYKQS